MARLYGRYLRSSAYSMGAAKSEFGQRLFDVGLDLAESEKKSEYSSKIAQANAQKIRSLDSLSQWMHENRDEPDRYEDYFNKEFWPQYEKDVTAGLKGTALRDIKNDLVVEKENILTGIREQRREQQVKNNIVNTQALIDEHEKPRAYDNIHELSTSLTSFADATRIAMDSGDVPELQTPEQHTELFERMSSFEVKNYILQHPDKEPGDEYYISHPNEFADDFGFSSAFRGKLFGPDETSDIKKEYNAQKNFDRRMTEEQLKAKYEKNEKSLYLRMVDPDNKDPVSIEELNTALANDDISIEFHESNYKVIKDGFAEKTDLKKYDIVKQALTRNESYPSETNRNAAYKSIFENAQYLDKSDFKTLLNEFYSDVSKIDATDKREAYADMANLLGGDPDINNIGNFLFQEPEQEEAWILAKILWDEEVSKAAEEGNPLDRLGKRTAAVRIAHQLNRELQNVSQKQLLMRYLSVKPLKPEEFAKYTKGAEAQPGEFKKVKTRKKLTREEFIQNVAQLKKQGKMEEAREYYDKWVGELWP